MKKSLSLLVLLIGCMVAVAQSVIIPEPIKSGDKIAIITPAGVCKDADIDRAVERIEELGFMPIVMPHAYDGEFGRYAAPDSLRAADILQAFADPEIKAIICSRGGYGCNHLLPLLDAEVIKQNPKWLVGYSDISALHAFMSRNGVASVHGPMGKTIAYADTADVSVNQLISLLTGVGEYGIEIDPNEYNNPGYARGKIVGGNLMVTNALAETPWDIMHPFALGDTTERENIILFIEDVDEQIYAIERVLYRLHQSGILNEISGLIVGDFTEYKPDKSYETMEQMIASHLREWGYYDRGLPVAFGLHSGHGEINTPLILGTEATLTITEDGTTINW